MDRASPATYRPLVAADVPAAYAVFRRSLFDYLYRIGMVDAATAADPPIASAWGSQGPWIEHLVGTAAENWVALDGDDRVIGWAMTVERDGVLELTHFFVEPGTQAKGIGRELLARAFPPGRGRHRVIIATGDAPALGMYLRAGVGYVTTAADFFRTPEAVEVGSDLEFERLMPGPAAVAAVGAVDEAILGHRRDVDVAFLLGNRPGWIARRDGAVAGIAFGAVGANSGPIGVLDPADAPALLRLVEREAHAAGLAELYFTVPLVNRVAVRELLARGFRIDPFYVNVLADEASMRLDRWVHTGPVFII